MNNIYLLPDLDKHVCLGFQKNKKINRSFIPDTHLLNIIPVHRWKNANGIE